MRWVLLALLLLAGPAYAQPNCAVVPYSTVTDALRVGAKKLDGRTAAAFMVEYNAVPPVSAIDADMVLFLEKDGHKLLGILKSHGDATVFGCLGEVHDPAVDRLITKYFRARS